jgi:hypothetical protein
MNFGIIFESFENIVELHFVEVNFVEFDKFGKKSRF